MNHDSQQKPNLTKLQFHFRSKEFNKAWLNTTLLLRQHILVSGRRTFFTPDHRINDVKIKKVLFLLVLHVLYLCVCVCIYPQGPEKSIGYAGAGVMAVSELPDMDAGN